MTLVSSIPRCTFVTAQRADCNPPPRNHRMVGGGEGEGQNRNRVTGGLVKDANSFNNHSIVNNNDDNKKREKGGGIVFLGREGRRIKQKRERDIGCTLTNREDISEIPGVRPMEGHARREPSEREARDTRARTSARWMSGLAMRGY